MEYRPQANGHERPVKQCPPQ